VPEPLRVALDATSLYDVPTGVGRFTTEVLREAATRPHLSVSAFAITLRGRGRLADLVPPGVSVAPARLPMAARPLRWAWRRWDHPRIDRWIGRADVVHGTNFVVPPTRAAAVVTIHDLTYLRYPEMCTPEVLEYGVLIPRALARGAAVHTVSEFVRQEVIDHYGLPAERVVAVPNGVTAPRPGDALAGRRRAGGDRYLLAVGTVEPRKDLPGLVAAFDQVAAGDPELRLVIAGTDGWGAEALTAAIARSRHAERIVRTGWVDEGARADLLAGATLLAVPSRYEGFGLPAAEAMAAGLPVVATAVGALPEVVGDAAVLVPGDDVSALAEALARVAGDDALRAELQARGLRRAATFTWARTADGLEALWHAAAADG
jgi:glycosyltransferase involved in cell wall biosynthesis